MSFGRKLKVLRVLHRMDQYTISKKLNISQSVYSRYENDRKLISRDDPVIIRMADLFNVSTVWLLEEGYGAIERNETLTLAEEDLPGILPKNFMNLLLKQQQMTEKLLKILSGKK